jgi:GNAT superfamily N-acetyltransferase
MSLIFWALIIGAILTVVIKAATPSHPSQTAQTAQTSHELSYNIRPYQETTSSMQQSVVDHIKRDVNSGYSSALITSIWPGNAKVFLVMTDATDSELIGTVAIDNLYISNLYVVPSKRKQGFGEILMRSAEKRAHGQAELHCKGEHLRYYTKLGWTMKTYVGDDTYLMTKTI